jgi:hypothetical protein
MSLNRLQTCVEASDPALLWTCQEYANCNVDSPVVRGLGCIPTLGE